MQSKLPSGEKMSMFLATAVLITSNLYNELTSYLTEEFRISITILDELSIIGDLHQAPGWMRHMLFPHAGRSK